MKQLFGSITREHVQYGLGILVCLAVVGVFVFTAAHVFSMGMAGFGAVLLGVANVSDYFNSPPGRVGQ